MTFHFHGISVGTFSRKLTGCFALAAAVLGLAAPAMAAPITFIGTSGGAWSDPNNWAYDPANPAPALPTASDNPILSGKTVNIDNYAAVMNQFNATGGSGVVNINDGGSLTGSHAYTLRYITTINVNDGGQFPLSPAWLMRTDVNVNEGGTLTGGSGIPQAEGKTFTVDGTFSPRGTTLASGTSFSVGAAGSNNYWGKFLLGSTGNVILDLYGDSSNEYFSVNGITNATELKIDTGTIELRPQGDYVPQIGDSFDLWNVADPDPILTVGDGSNIVLPGYTLDTSAWITDGVVTVSGTVPIPEPASLALLGLGAIAVLRRRR